LNINQTLYPYNSFKISQQTTCSFKVQQLIALSSHHEFAATLLVHVVEMELMCIWRSWYLFYQI